MNVRVFLLWCLAGAASGIVMGTPMVVDAIGATRLSVVLWPVATALALGSAQAFVLMLSPGGRSRAGWWLVATVMGILLGTLVALALGVMLTLSGAEIVQSLAGTLSKNEVGTGIAFAVSVGAGTAAGGLVLGLLQALAVDQIYPLGAWWIWANVAGGFAMLFLLGYGLDRRVMPDGTGPPGILVCGLFCLVYALPTGCALARAVRMASRSTAAGSQQLA